MSVFKVCIGSLVFKIFDFRVLKSVQTIETVALLKFLLEEMLGLRCHGCKSGGAELGKRLLGRRWGFLQTFVRFALSYVQVFALEKEPRHEEDG